MIEGLNLRHPKLKNRSLTVILLFFLFTFSGFAGELNAHQQTTTQTELIISSASKKRPGRTVSFQRFPTKSEDPKSFRISEEKRNASLFQFKRLIKIRLHNYSARYIPVKDNGNIFKTKYTLRSADDYYISE
jgi:hypothetical protein